MQSKGAILVGFIALLAFVWGYKKDSFTFDLSAIKGWFRSAEPIPGTPPGSSGEPPTPEAAASSSLGVGVITTTPHFGMSAGPGNTPPRFPSSSGFNPFAGNIDAIRRDPTEESAGPPRNAYFDKLSQQMKELQQQTSLNSLMAPNPLPPPFPQPTDPGNPAPPPEPGMGNVPPALLEPEIDGGDLEDLEMMEDNMSDTDLIEEPDPDNPDDLVVD